MSKTDAAEQMALDWMLTANAVTRPTAWYVALHSADPGETVSPTNELTGGGYSRQSVTFSRTGSVASNTADLTFGPATGAAWPTITHASVWTASTLGTCIYDGATTNRTINVGDSYEIPAGSLQISED